MIDTCNCAGCYNDVYNGQLAPRCWNADKAAMVYHVDQAPPYKDLQLQKVPDCYKKQRFVTVQPTAIRKDGYWA
jgi:hypothetical protein